jgi:adenosylmethionine-8-amino-7-oxononanoate aminotransferase
MVSPPLIASEGEIDEIADRLEKTFREAEAELATVRRSTR